MTADQLRKKYLDFFVSKGHTVIPSASLIPENDPTVLFTTAGMHPLVPFLLGESHPAGKRLVNYQRCIRTSDIDLVGDDTHLTFFEMLGNWSLGDYWKKEAIEWSWEFLTDKKWLALDPKRIYVTCFAGDADAPKDEETASIWKSVGIPEERIAFLGKEDNWWGPAGDTGPCGPDTEMFYQVSTVDESASSADERPKGAEKWPPGKYVEIWNDVFMQYNKTPEGTFEPLKQKNVDTGMGVERTLTVVNNLSSVFQTDVFDSLIAFICADNGSEHAATARIVADHWKAAVFLIADGVLPSNKDQGYVVRRFIRKAITKGFEIGFRSSDDFINLGEKVIALYKNAYAHLTDKKKNISEALRAEEQKFVKTLERGLKMLESYLPIIKTDAARAAEVAFDMKQTFGFPTDLTYDLFVEREALPIVRSDFDVRYRMYEERHKELSRRGAKQKFKGGLADHSDIVVRSHTATHLLHQALKDVLGNHVQQKGSNITSERLRFDFTHPQKMTKEELQKVESIVNEKINDAISVEKKILPIDEARKLGATGLFGEKYGDTVSVYLIGDYSKEFCGGPHVQNTKEIGSFHIKKEESVSAGVRRIKAVVE